jgi:hypothetical protein
MESTLPEVCVYPGPDHGHLIGIDASQEGLT